MMNFKKILPMILIWPYTQLLTADTFQNGDRNSPHSNYEYKSWQSGNAVTPRYNTRPVAQNISRQRVQSNPWKKKAFTYNGYQKNQLRPWGNVPQSRTQATKGMRYFDEKFKQSSHRFDAAYTRQLMSQNFPTYSTMGGMNHRYGMYQNGGYPPPGYYRNNRGLFGLMKNFMPW